MQFLRNLITSWPSGPGAGAVSRRGSPGRPEPWGDRHWWRDPLSHPEIRRLSERDLADLPFDPSRIEPD